MRPPPTLLPWICPCQQLADVPYSHDVKKFFMSKIIKKCISCIPLIVATNVYIISTLYNLQFSFTFLFQVFSNSVKIAFALSKSLREETESTQLFISMMDRFFDCLNVRRLGQDKQTRKPELAPYTRADDWRFDVIHILFIRIDKQLLNLMFI